MKITVLKLIAVVVSIVALSSCVPLAVGAAAGYVARDQGYGVQNPITHNN